MVMTIFTPNPPTNIVGFRGLDSSIILNLRGGILMPIGDLPETLSQAMLVGVAGFSFSVVGRRGGVAGVMLVRGLGVHPIRILRFRSFRTQPLANLTPLPIKKGFLGNPTLGTNLGSRILGMRIGCSADPSACSLLGGADGLAGSLASYYHYYR